jgi:hypothetical protein
VRRAPLTALRHVRPNGGAVPALALTIARVFPLIYMEKVRVEDEEGEVTETKTMRGAAAEAAYAEEHERRAEGVRESAAAAAMEAASRERDARRRQAGGAGAQQQQQQQAYDGGDDAALSAAAMRAHEKDNEHAAAAIHLAVQAALEAAQLTPRDVTPLLKLRVVGLAPGGCAAGAGEAVLTVWRPEEDALATLVEGATFVITNVSTSAHERKDGGGGGGAGAAPPPRGRARDGGLLELTTSRSGRWLRASPGAGALRGLISAYAPRVCVPLAALGAYERRPTDAALEATRAAEAAAAHASGACNAACAAAGAAAVAAAIAAAAAAPCVPLGAMFDAVGVLVHAAQPRPSGQRGARQFAFFADPSLAALAAQAANADGGEDMAAADMTLLAVEARALPVATRCVHGDWRVLALEALTRIALFALASLSVCLSVCLSLSLPPRAADVLPRGRLRAAPGRRVGRFPGHGAAPRGLQPQRRAAPAARRICKRKLRAGPAAARQRHRCRGARRRQRERRHRAGSGAGGGGGGGNTLG